jgi:hypothetical protein
VYKGVYFNGKPKYSVPVKQGSWSKNELRETIIMAYIYIPSGERRTEALRTVSRYVVFRG